MSNTIEDVRNELMATLRDLRNREAPMDIDRAKAVAQVAGVMVESAKVEVLYLQTTGQRGSTFLGSPGPALVAPESKQLEQASPFPTATDKPRTQWRT
jgi:hypothetical protein